MVDFGPIKSALCRAPQSDPTINRPEKDTPRKGQKREVDDLFVIQAGEQDMSRYVHGN